MTQEQRIADTLVQKPSIIDFDIRPRYDYGIKAKVERFFRNIGLVATERTFEIKPITAGVLLKISSKLSEVELDDTVFNNDKEAFHVGLEAIKKYKDVIIYIAACAIWGKKTEPPKWLIRILDDNTTPRDLYKILGEVIKKMGVQDFLQLTASVAQINVLKPENPSTSGESSEESKNILKAQLAGKNFSGKEAGQT